MSQRDQPGPLESVSKSMPYQAARDLVVQQALTVADWQQCCADIMGVYGIDIDTVKREITRRARLLVWIPFLAQEAVVLATIAMYRPEWFRSFGAISAIALISFHGCAMSQVLYYLWLQHLHKAGSYILWTKAILVGTVLPLLIILCVVAAVFPQMTTITSVDLALTQPLFLILTCTMVPPMLRHMQHNVRELSTSRDQPKQLDTKTSG